MLENFSDIWPQKGKRISYNYEMLGKLDLRFLLIEN